VVPLKYNHIRFNTYLFWIYYLVKVDSVVIFLLENGDFFVVAFFSFLMYCWKRICVDNDDDDANDAADFESDGDDGDNDKFVKFDGFDDNVEDNDIHNDLGENDNKQEQQEHKEQQ